MATTTPNFGWPVPTSSDLVKNGATAIEGLGDAIDASLLDLKGGTTGQVLAKASNTDMDFSWVVQDDANAIQNTQLTAKGALISAVSAGTPATLTVGTNNQVLTADSSTATGLKWASAAAGGAYTQLATGSLTGSSVSITSISQSYKDLVIYLDNTSLSGQNEVRFTFNSNTGSLYGFSTINNGALTTSGSGGVGSGYVGTFPAYQDSTSATLTFPFYYTTRRPTWVINTGSFPSNGSPMAYFQFGASNFAGPITSIQLFPNTGTFSTGTYTLFGVN